MKIGLTIAYIKEIDKVINGRRGRLKVFTSFFKLLLEIDIHLRNRIQNPWGLKKLKCWWVYATVCVCMHIPAIHINLYRLHHRLMCLPQGWRGLFLYGCSCIILFFFLYKKGLNHGYSNQIHKDTHLSHVNAWLEKKINMIFFINLYLYHTARSHAYWFVWIYW